MGVVMMCDVDVRQCLVGLVKDQTRAGVAAGHIVRTGNFCCHRKRSPASVPVL